MSFCFLLFLVSASGFELCVKYKCDCYKNWSSLRSFSYLGTIWFFQTWKKIDFKIHIYCAATLCRVQNVHCTSSFNQFNFNFLFFSIELEINGIYCWKKLSQRLQTNDSKNFVYTERVNEWILKNEWFLHLKNVEK